MKERIRGDERKKMMGDERKNEGGRERGEGERGKKRK